MTRHQDDNELHHLSHVVRSLEKCVGNLEEILRSFLHHEKHTDKHLAHRLDKLFELGERNMATLQEVKDQLVTLAADIASEKAEVQALLNDLKAQIQALKDQIASGGLVSQADLDALSATLATIDSGVKDISEPVTP